ncbi:hypothetical protein HAX54_044128 [Datura stramonium]|uniref:Uncharacterized protein n=1 Tax=Datura stramonium TaxID=4076 RepID=A0ABS8W3L0_DATST|nr:hypothetical protein [Datura stramonium]
MNTTQKSQDQATNGMFNRSIPDRFRLGKGAEGKGNNEGSESDLNGNDMKSSSKLALQKSSDDIMRGIEKTDWCGRGRSVYDIVQERVVSFLSTSFSNSFTKTGFERRRETTREMCLRRHVSKLCTLREEERCSQLLPQESRPIFLKGLGHCSNLHLGLPTEQHGLAAPPLAEAKRLKSALKKVASVALFCANSPPVAEERVTVHTRVFQFLRKLFLTSQSSKKQELYLYL